MYFQTVLSEITVIGSYWQLELVISGYWQLELIISVRTGLNLVYCKIESAEL